MKLRANQFKEEKTKEESVLQSFNSYLGVLSHGNTHELEQKLRHKLWEWLKTPILGKKKG